MHSITLGAARRTGSLLRAGLALACASVGAAQTATTTGSSAKPAPEPQFENYVDVAAGGTLLDGDRAQFQKLRNENKDGWGGLEAFRYTRDLGNNTTLSAAGRALIGNHDFRLDLTLTREEVGFLRFGFQEYRT